MLVQILVLHIGLSARHLQCDEALLGALFDDVDTRLEPIASTIDLLAEVLHHLLELIDHSADGWIDRFSGFGAVRVVERIEFYGLRSPIPDC
jgi:hypothetical protein